MRGVEMRLGWLSIGPQLNPHWISLHETEVAEDITPDLLQVCDYSHAYRDILLVSPDLQFFKTQTGKL